MKQPKEIPVSTVFDKIKVIVQVGTIMSAIQLLKILRNKTPIQNLLV